MSDPQPATTTRVESETHQGEIGLYLYGIGLAPSEDELTSLDEAFGETGIQMYRRDDLVAFARSVPLSEFSEEEMKARMQDQQWLIGAVQHHHQVIASLAERIALLPASFGVVYGSEASLLDSLNENSDALGQQLQHISGCDEWALHIYREESGVRERILAADPELRRMSAEVEEAPPGRAYLMKQQLEKRLSRAIEEQQLVIADSLLDQVQEFTRAVQVEQPRTSDQDDQENVEIAQASLLVPRDRSEPLLAALSEAADSSPEVRLEVSGPWPVYSFTRIETET